MEGEKDERTTCLFFSKLKKVARLFTPGVEICARRLLSLFQEFHKT